MTNLSLFPIGAATTGHAVLRRVLSRSEEDSSTVTAIAEGVGSAIIEGRLAPGADLNTVDLAKQFKSSRTPVREALMLLENEGLVEINPRRRPRVAQLSVPEVYEINQVRANLYALVAELIVVHASDEAICLLEPLRDQMVTAVKAGDLDAYFWGNVAFHDVETAICGNSYVKRILDSIMLRVLRLRYLRLSEPDSIERSLANHEALLRAYKERDVALAIAVKRGAFVRGLDALDHTGLYEFKSEDVKRIGNGALSAQLDTASAPGSDAKGVR